MNDNDKKALDILLDGLQDMQHFVSFVDGCQNLTELQRGYIAQRDIARQLVIDFVEKISEPCSDANARPAGEGATWGLPEEFRPMTLEEDNEARFNDYLNAPESYRCNGVY